MDSPTKNNITVVLEDQNILDLIKADATRDKGFRALIDKYKQKLYWQIRRMVLVHDDADDVLQNTFIKVFKSIDRFEQKSSLFTWLYRIATNETLSFLEQQKKYHYDTVDDHQEHPAIARLKADPYFDGDELRLKLEQVMQSLPEKQRMVFQLRYYEELSYKEIADILDTTEGALKVSYHHALKKVEDYFKSK